jgi:hypothetical protein
VPVADTCTAAKTLLFNLAIEAAMRRSGLFALSETYDPNMLAAWGSESPAVERGQSEHATGLSGLRLTDNEKMSIVPTNI